MKKSNVLLLVLLISSLSLYLGLHTTIVNTIGQAVQDTTQLTIVISCPDTQTVPLSGNVTFNQTCIQGALIQITNLTIFDVVNVTLYGPSYPYFFDEPEPNVELAGDNRYEYMIINVSNETDGRGPFNVYFNLTRARLGSANESNVTLFVFEANWTQQNTTLLNASLDPLPYVATVSHFSTYFVGEKPTLIDPDVGGGAAPAAAGGGGGGGGSSTITTEEEEPALEVLPAVISVKLKQGEQKQRTITIKNNDGEIMNVDIDTSSLFTFLDIHEDSFILGPNEDRTILLDFSAQENQQPNIYAGIIEVRGGSQTENVRVIIEVVEEEPLFEIEVDVFGSEYVPGDIIDAKIELASTLSEGNIVLSYALVDFEENIIDSRQDNLLIEDLLEKKDQNDKIELKRTLELPLETISGFYTFQAKIIYEENIRAVGSDTFKVVGEPLVIEIREPFLSIFGDLPIYVWQIIIIVLLIFLTYVIYHIPWYYPYFVTKLFKKFKHMSPSKLKNKEVILVEKAIAKKYARAISLLENKRIDKRFSKIIKDLEHDIKLAQSKKDIKKLTQISKVLDELLDKSDTKLSKLLKKFKKRG